MNVNKIDVLVVNEADLYGKNSRIRRNNPVEQEVLDTSLRIEDYKLCLPLQWTEYDQARTIIYTRNNLIVTQVKHD